MAYQTVTPATSWPAKLQALADGDTITGSAMLALARDYADALTAIRVGNLMSWTSLGSSAKWGVVNTGGNVYGIGATNSFRTGVVLSSPSSWGSSTGLPGGLSPAAAVPTAGNAGYALFLAAGFSYRSNGTSFDAGVALAGITTPGDIVWCPGGSRFVAVGTSAGGGRICYGANGSAWSAATGEPAADTNWAGSGKIACDGASTLVAVPTATATGSTSIWYSTDGGQNWTEKSHGGGNIAFCGVGYDTARGAFVAVDASNGDAYVATDPAGTWSPNTAFSYGTLADFTCVGGLWVGMSATVVYVSANAFTTTIIGGAPAGAGNLARIYRVGQRLAAIGASDSYLSGPVF